MPAVHGGRVAVGAPVSHPELLGGLQSAGAINAKAAASARSGAKVGPGAGAGAGGAEGRVDAGAGAQQRAESSATVRADAVLAVVVRFERREPDEAGGAVWAAVGSLRGVLPAVRD